MVQPEVDANSELSARTLCEGGNIKWHVPEPYRDNSIVTHTFKFFVHTLGEHSINFVNEFPNRANWSALGVYKEVSN
jgi:hypothetical protein